MTRLIEQQGGYEEWVLAPARHLLADLVAHDDWLPKLFAMPDPEHHREYLLYGDPLDRFSLVSFVWGAGQKTPVHDHLTWGLMGVLRGGLDEVSYRFGGRDGELIPSRTTRLTPGLVSAVSPNLGDIHMLSNAVMDGVTVSVHVYGGNIGTRRRHRYDPMTGEVHDFISGYSSPVTPNLWAIG